MFDTKIEPEPSWKPRMKCIDFQPIHLTQMIPREIDNRYICAINDLTQLGERFLAYGPCITLVSGDYVIASGGVSIISPGVGDCWVFCNQGVSKYKYGLILYSKRLLHYATVTHHLHRLQADVSVDHDKSKRFMRLLGFHIESVLYMYGPNKEDYLRYAKFPKVIN